MRFMRFGFRTAGLLALALALVFVVDSASANEKSLPFVGTERVIGDSPPPQVLWSPWIPVGSQVGTRSSFGIRLSGPSLRIHCPVELKVTWDPAMAKGGRELEFRVKAAPTAASGSEKTLDSNFGVDLPTRVQAGFLGITGLPDIVPWFDLPIDLWATFGFLPPPFNQIPAAVSNVSVSMQGTDALPLGPSASAKFSASRALLTVPFSTLSSAGPKSKLVEKLNNAIPRKSDIKAALKVVSLLDSDQIEEKINSALGQGVNLLSNLGSFKIIGEPYWKIANGELRVVVGYRVPGKFLEGTVPITFPGAGLPGDGSRLVKLRLPYFLDNSDTLEVFLTRVEYQFDLYQGLGGKLSLSGPSVNLPAYEKKIGRLTAAKEFPADPQSAGQKISLPLAPSDQPLGNVSIVTGSDTVRLAFATNRPGRGGLIVSDAATHAVVKRVEGRAGQRYHFIWATGLSPDHAYVVDGYCLTDDGTPHGLGQTYSVTTTSSPTGYTAVSTVGENEFSSYPTVQAGPDWLEFTWGTNHPTTTEVRLAPTDDIAHVHLPASKHANGTWIGGVDNEPPDLGPKEQTTSHSIRVTGLTPGTTYLYSVHSGVYNGAVQASSLLGTLRYNGAAQTTGSPPVPMRVFTTLTPSQHVGGVSVSVFRTSPDYLFLGYYTTGNDGRTPPITVQPGEVYRLESRNHPCYEDNTVNYTVPTGNATPQAEVRVAYRPTGGAVLTPTGAAVSGAKVQFIGSGGTHYTSSDGSFNVNGIAPGLHDAEISKTGFFTTRAPIAFNACGRMEHRIIALSPTSAQLTVRVKGTNLSTKASIPLSGTQVKLLPTSGAHQDLGATNSAGEVTTTIAFNTPQDRKYTIQVLPGYDSPYYVANSPQVTHRPGVDQVVEVFPPLRLPPLIENVNLQTIPQGIRLTFRLNEARNGDEYAGQGGADYRTPAGQNKSLPFAGGMIRNHDKTIAETAWGCYQVQAAAKDRFNRVVKDAPPVEFLRWSDTAFNLRSSQAIGQSAVVSWDALKGCTRFAKYVLTLEGRPGISLNDAGTTSHTFHGLAPRKTYKVTLRAKDSTGSWLTPAATIDLATASQPPVIKQFATNPGEPPSKTPVTVSALVTDDDSNELTLRLKLDGRRIAQQTFNTKRAEFSHEFQAPNPGVHVLVLEASDESNTQRKTLKLRVVRALEPPKITARLISGKIQPGKTCELHIALKNAKKTAKPVQVVVAWGDGEKYTKTMGRAKCTLVHRYQNEGKYTLVIAPQTGTAPPGGGQSGAHVLTGEPVTLEVEVAPVPPRMRLSCTGSKNRKTCAMSVVPTGGGRLSRWQLEFGDGSAPFGGQGMPPAVQTHCYPQTLSKKLGGTSQTYRAVLTVWDNKNHAFEEIDEVKVSPGANDDCLGQTQSGGGGLRTQEDEGKFRERGSDTGKQRK